MIICDDGCGSISRECLTRNLVSAADICTRKNVQPSTVNSWIKRHSDWPEAIIPPQEGNGIGGRWWWPEIESFLTAHQLPNKAMQQGAIKRHSQ